eukprot:m.294150 g.294150  ORF g.294150 m.294150 type:complete len:459 (+) comp12935_c0_seq1:2078-3454(+)
MQVIVVGGGLVGSLVTILLAQRGYTVRLYEGRKDIRKEPRYKGLSINLALSTRGIAALEAAGLAEEITREGLPMGARMIHSHSGDQSAQPYGTPDQAILSIDRRNLNEMLLNRAESFSNVTLFFDHKCTSHSLRAQTVEFVHAGVTRSDKADLIIGADGAHSTIRRFLMRYVRMDFEQIYIPHGYKELTIPASAEGEFQLRERFLHIWPRQSFMMIALPNQDKTFTATLFMPYDKFDTIKTPDEIIELFETEFPDAVPLLGKKKIVEDYQNSPTGRLIQIKCAPYHGNRTLIIGDAAHAMVPFYGQGMNAGFEDCLILSELFSITGGDVDAVLAAFSDSRNADAKAICDLARYNYVEMRDSVNSKWFIFRKKIDNLLHKLFPKSFIPLYTMVTFSQIPYATVIERHRRQQRMVDIGLGVAAASVLGGAALLAYRSSETVQNVVKAAYGTFLDILPPHP